MRAKPPPPCPPSSSPKLESNLPNPAIPNSASILAKHVPTNQSQLQPSSRGPSPPIASPAAAHSLCTCTCHQTSATTQQIPPVYRIWHLYLEPTFSLSGACHLLFSPAKYHAYTPSTVPYIPVAQHTCNQLAACYVFIALFEALFLRKFEDRKVWNAALVGLFWCDLGHLVADVREEWPARGLGWIGFAITVLGLSIRLGFLMGVGMDDEQEKEEEKKEEDI